MKEAIEPNLHWDRLSQVIRRSGLSIHRFAKAIGLKRAENLYQIKKGKNRISCNLAYRIHALYPMYSVGWLLTGEKTAPAEPFPEPSAMDSGTALGLPIATLPFYRSLVGRDMYRPMIPDGCLHLSECLCHGALLATVFRGSHLYPLLPCHCIVLLKPCTPDQVTDGSLYYIETRSLRIFRIVQAEEDSSLWTLTTPAGDNDLKIERKEVRAVMEIVGVMHRNNNSKLKNSQMK